jgi:hypothetical protein
MGGALSRPAPHHGARQTMDCGFLYFAVAPVMPEIPVEAIEASLQRTRAAVAPGKAQADYLNFTEKSGRLSDFFDSRTMARIEQIKAEYDSGNLFMANFEV